MSYFNREAVLCGHMEFELLPASKTLKQGNLFLLCSIGGHVSFAGGRAPTPFCEQQREEKQVGKYNSTEFKKEWSDYIAVKKKEYDACWTAVSQYFTWYTWKKEFEEKELYPLIDQYDQAKRMDNNVDQAKQNLVNKVYEGANYYSNRVLRKWWYRLKVEPALQQEMQPMKTVLDQKQNSSTAPVPG